MDRKHIEKLKKISVQVADAHEHDCVCGFSPDFDFGTGKQLPQVHLSCEEFRKTFDECQVEEFDEEQDKIFAYVDGVKFYALAKKEVE